MVSNKPKINNKPSKFWPIIWSTFLILASFIMIVMLHHYAVTEAHLKQAKIEAEQTTIEVQEPPSIDEILAKYKSEPSNGDKTYDAVSKVLDRNQVKNQQIQINNAIRNNHLQPDELGYLFLPLYPSESVNLSNIKQNKVPLLLQKDIHWRDLKYGSGNSDKIGENGCAILSLAMVHSALSNEIKDPSIILDWAKNDYYVENSGTSWLIFSEFANKFNYQFFNHGNNFSSAMDSVKKGEIVIASVKPGYFTEVGHIIVIRGYENGKVYVNDPNDDSTKMYSISGIDESVLINEATNYWSFAKKS